MKKGIKVKDLATELGLTSRAVIDGCRANGIFVQNSITKLDRARESRVRAVLAKGDPEQDSAGANS